MQPLQSPTKGDQPRAPAERFVCCVEPMWSTDDSVAVMHQYQHDCEIELEHDPNMRASVMIDILRNAIEAVMEAREATHAGYMALSPLEDDLECSVLPVVDVL